MHTANSTSEHKAGFTFSSKAETLRQLQGLLQHASVLPQICFTKAQWQRDQQALLNAAEWLANAVIVRSSAAAEDGCSASLAGHFESVLNVQGIAAIITAVEKAFATMDNPEDQVFIQPMLENTAVAGVAFTREPSGGGHYYVINFDDESGQTDTVTSGTTNSLHTWVCAKGLGAAKNQLAWMQGLLQTLAELEQGFGCSDLDVEFAVDQQQKLFVLQVRPLVAGLAHAGLSLADQHAALTLIEERVSQLSGANPFLHGDRSVFGVMPDWNPAEIIGIKPRPLALSLYKELVTDNTWAYQRNNYGYKNLRSFPLLVSLHGLPYIDVRVSFNSFIPADINEDLAEKLVNHYIERLVEQPSKHDKVEFEIIYSCYSLDLLQRLDQLPGSDFSKAELNELANALRGLTNNIIQPDTGLWKKDIGKLKKLEERQQSLFAADMPVLDKVYWLLEDCKRYGTLPFAGLARAGFIAVQLLRSLVTTGVLTEQDYQTFLGSLNTVSSRIARDFKRFSKAAFLEQYGHLRPGTYDLLSPRYDQAPDHYFDWQSQQEDAHEPAEFQLSLKQMERLDQLLKVHEIKHDVLTFFGFIKGAIEGREYGKFVFSKSLSMAMELMRSWAQENNIAEEDFSYVDYSEIKSLYSSSFERKAVLQESVARGRQRFAITRALVLPPLIVTPEDVWQFRLPEDEPNFITLNNVQAEVVTDLQDTGALRGKIIMIANADPGYDWLFAKNIAGLITEFGGANSHMAIRAGELGITAVIGCGEKLYRQWATASVLKIDCALKQVSKIQ